MKSKNNQIGLNYNIMYAPDVISDTAIRILLNRLDEGNPYLKHCTVPTKNIIIIKNRGFILF